MRNAADKRGGTTGPHWPGPRDFYDTERYGVVCEPDGRRVVIDKQDGNRRVFGPYSATKCHKEARLLNAGERARVRDSDTTIIPEPKPDHRGQG